VLLDKSEGVVTRHHIIAILSGTARVFYGYVLTYPSPILQNTSVDLI
jgi:hypothetical protein